MFARGLLVAVLLLGAVAESGAVDGVQPDVRFNPAEGTGHEAFERGLEERNRQRQEEAGERGESHLDVVPGIVGEPQREAVDPPEVRSRPVEPEEPEAVQGGGDGTVPVGRVQPRREWTGEPVQPTGEDDGNLDAVIAALIEAINRPPDIRRISYGAPEEERREGGGSLVPQPERPLPRVGAGDAFYARVMHAVNSDYPGPVLIELLQPPLAGAVARGEFQLVRERMVIRLSSLDVAGETVPVDAVAVGLDCACFGVSGDVSYHWWERVLLPAATGFVEQLSALSVSDGAVIGLFDGHRSRLVG